MDKQQKNKIIDDMEETSKLIALTLHQCHTVRESLLILLITTDSILETSDEKTRNEFNELRNLMKKRGTIKWMN